MITNYLNRFYYLIFGAIILNAPACKLSHSLSYIKRTTSTDVLTPLDKPLTIPFVFKNGQIMLKAAVGGKGTDTANLFFDSGASTLLSSDFADEHHLNLVAHHLMRGSVSTPLNGAATNTASYTANNIKINLHGLELYKEEVSILPIKSQGFVCNKADGFLGSDVLCHFGVYVDIEHKNLSLYNPEQIPDSILAYPYHLTFKPRIFQKIPLVNINLWGIDYQAIWDFGYNGTISLQYDKDNFADFDKLIQKPYNKIYYENKATSSDLSGKDTTLNNFYTYAVDSLKQGAINMLFAKTNITVLKNHKIDMMQCNIGTAWMKQFRIFISWKTKTIYLKPIANKPSYQSLSDVLFIYDNTSGLLKVGAISTACQAYIMGARAGDTVTKLDDKTVKDLLNNLNDCERLAWVRSMKHDMSTMEIMKKGSVKTISMK